MAIGVIDEEDPVIRSNPGPIFRRCEQSEAISLLSFRITRAIPVIRFDKTHKNAILRAYDISEVIHTET